MSHPEIEIMDEQVDPLKILPIYSINEEMKKSRMEQRFFRKLIWQAFSVSNLELPYLIPEEAAKDLGFIEEKENLFRLHFPQTMAEAMIGRRQLKLTELWPVALELTHDFLMSLDHGIAQIFDGSLADRFLAELPFELTPSQEEALEEIRRGLQIPHQYRGLVQGDVGSGKTVVALLSALYVIESGRQVAFVAPTEILAKQHYKECIERLEPIGVRVELVTGSTPRKLKDLILQRTEAGEVDLLIGTHSLFQPDIKFSDLALCLIDEQHRFGVEQRNDLFKKGDFPDILQLTATPIPRSLLQTLYGDSTPVTIRQKPTGRKPIKTRIVPFTRRSDLKKYISEEITEGNRAYWIAPRVTDEEDSNLESVESLVNELSELPHKIGGLHGKMKEDLKSSSLEKFRTGETEILVATTVVEVGVNVPEANIIVIESADRFGLAQLHQLRGRVGRGSQQAWCFLLFSEQPPEDTEERLKGFTDTEDGFQISELDLKLRGAGDLSGLRQSGRKPFQFFDFMNDLDLVKEMRAYCEIYLRRQAQKEL